MTCSPLRRKARAPEAGQATVELALALPLVVLLVLALLQVVVVARDHLAVWHAARVGARAAAISSAPASDGVAAARASVALEPLEVNVQAHAVWVTVTVTHTNSTDLPLIGRLLPDVDVRARATMAREPP